MKSPNRSILFPLALSAVVGLAACGSDDASSDATPTTTPDVTDEAPADSEDEVSAEEPSAQDAGEQGAENEVDDDHDDDKDHDDEDHDDDDHEDHDDEDHDEDHDHDEGSGELGAHEHGTAEMTVAWIDDEIAIDLISPTFNVFGFEYEPTSDDDLAIEAEQTEALTSPGVVVVNDEAGCTLTDPVATEVERDGSHSEITVSWLFECDNGDEISDVDASGLFDAFPNFEDVDVEWISDSEQSSAELSPSETSFTLQQ